MLPTPSNTWGNQNTEELRPYLKWQSRDLNPRSLTPKLMLFAVDPPMGLQIPLKGRACCPAAVGPGSKSLLALRLVKSSLCNLSLREIPQPGLCPSWGGLDLVTEQHEVIKVTTQDILPAIFNPVMPARWTEALSGVHPCQASTSAQSCIRPLSQGRVSNPIT